MGATAVVTSASGEKPERTRDLGADHVVNDREVKDWGRAVAEEAGSTPSQGALAWTLANPAVVSPVVGARTLARAKEKLALSTWHRRPIIAPAATGSAIPIRSPGPPRGTAHGMAARLRRGSAIHAVGDTVLVRFDGSAATTSCAPCRNRFLWMVRMKDGPVVGAEAFLDVVAYRQVIENDEPRAIAGGRAAVPRPAPRGDRQPNPCGARSGLHGRQPPSTSRSPIVRNVLAAPMTAPLSSPGLAPIDSLAAERGVRRRSGRDVHEAHHAEYDTGSLRPALASRITSGLPSRSA